MMCFRRAALIAACLAVPSLAQQVFLNEDGQPVNDPNANAVYVRDSGVATERLALAERLEKQKEWAKSADVYAEVTSKFADRVVPSKFDDKAKPTQYISAARLVQDRIARWPAKGLAAYRKRFEDTARDLLNAADPDAAAKVVEAYFVTDAGRDAAVRVMAEAFERGDFSTAAGTGRRLLETHPGLTTDRPAVLLRTGLAEHLAGRGADAQSRLDELKSRFPDALARVAGEDTKAADALAAALATPVDFAGFRSDDWPTAFGSPDAAAVPDQVSSGGARLFGIDLPGPTPRGSPVNRNSSNQKTIDRDRGLGLATGVLPSVDGGTLFFQDNANVYAINLASGLPLPGWRQSNPNDARGAFAIDAVPMPRGKQLAVTVTPQSVVALLGQVDASVANAAQPPQIVCLDRVTGRRTWSAAPPRLNLPNELANLKEGVFYGTPVVDGDTVYALLNANRGGQFEECYVVALRLSDGGFKWSTYVASTSLGGQMMDMMDGGGNFATGSAAAISLSAGRLFVLTNLGALACLDTAAGHVRWLNVYPRNNNAAAIRRVFYNRLPSNKPFLFGPPIVADGRVFVLPTDASSIFVCDADDGTIVRELPRKLEPTPPELQKETPARYQDMQTLLAVTGPSMVLANRGAVVKIPWQTLDPKKSLIDNGGRYYNVTPAKGDTAGDSIRGRPFVSADAILVPTGDRLYRIALPSFKLAGQYPAQGTWDADESAGNVLATPENLIIAGPTQVSVYADLSAATAKLDERLKANPGDVDALERYAELLFAAGQPQPALAKLDEAAAKLGGLATLTPGPGRDRLFEIAVGFAAKLDKGDGSNATLASDVFDRAAAAARSPVQQVRYRLARAAVYRTANNAPAELALHQEILANAEWRATTVAGKTGPSTAAAEAELGITELIRLKGASLYADYDARAAERLTELQSAETPDPDALLTIADEFPLAKAAPDALTQAAEDYESAGQPRRATQTLRRLLKGDLSNERRQVTLQALARNYLTTPGQVAIARVRLTQAKSLAPAAKLIKPLVLPNGTALEADTVTDAVAAIETYATQARDDLLPKLGIPPDVYDPARPPLRPAVEIAPASAIVKQPADAVRNDRVLVWGTDRRVGVVTAASGQVQWTDAAPADAPTGAGYIGDTLVVVSPAETVAVDPAGKVLWKLPAATLSPVELTVSTPQRDAVAVDAAPQGGRVIVNQRVIINGQVRIIGGGGRLLANRLQLAGGDDEDGQPTSEQFTRFRLLGDRVILATGTGRVMAVDAVTGRTLWQNRVAESGPTHLLANEDFVAAGFVDPANGSAAYAFDAVTGQVVLHRNYDGNTDPGVGGLVNLAMSPDGVLVTMQAGRLTAIDLYDPGSGDRKYPSDAQRGGNVMLQAPFQMSNSDGQLVITADKVLAVYGANTGQQSVRAYDLRTLQPMKSTDANTNREGERAFGQAPPDSDGTPLRILASGRSFYLARQRSVSGFDLLKPDAKWTPISGAKDAKPNRDVVLSRDYVIQIAPTSLVNANADKLPRVKLSMYSRARVGDDVESGGLTQNPTLTDPAGLLADAWQVTDGAFFYVSGDQKLKACRVGE